MLGGLGVWLKLVDCLPSKCEALSSNPNTGIREGSVGNVSWVPLEAHASPGHAGAQLG
jgi:hypothetical protein